MDTLSFDARFARDVSGLSVRSHGEATVGNAMLAIVRRRGVVLAALLLSVAVGATVLALLPAKYVSEALLQLDLSRRDGAYGPGTSPAVALEATALVQGEARIIRSRVIARRVVDRLGLADGPDRDDGPTWLGKAKVVLADLLHRVRPGAGSSEAASAAPHAAQDEAAMARQARVADAVGRLLGSLTVGTDNRSYLVTVGYASRDPAEAARLANAFAEEYLSWRSETNAAIANRTGEWLASRIAETASELRAAEAEITEFRGRTGLLGTGIGQDAESMPQMRLRSLIGQLEAARLAQLTLSQRLARVQDLLRSGRVPSSSDLQGLPLVATLLEQEATARREYGVLSVRLGARHPSVLEAQAGLAELRTRIDSELRRTNSVIEAELAGARRTEAELARSVEGVHRQMVTGKENETELQNLLSKAQVIRDRATSLQRSYEQAVAARDMRSVLASLVQPAEQEQIPASPKPTMIMAISLAGGLGIGIIGVMLLERRDVGLRSGADVRTHFDLRCLGMIPEVPAGGANSSRKRRLQASFDEAVYAVGAGVSLFSSPKECRVVLVTSALAGEGKSTLCEALSRALVASGRRVLVIGGAPVRAGLPGLVEAGPRCAAAAHGTGPETKAAAAALQAPEQVGGSLTVVDRKVQFPQAADVFGPSGFGRLLAEARGHFDVILLEGAPVMLVADSLVLGRVADTVIVTARWGETRRRVVGAALQKLQDHSIAVDGVVLSRVDLRRHARSRAMDDGQFYWRERRFYERLARRWSDAGGKA